MARDVEQRPAPGRYVVGRADGERRLVTVGAEADWHEIARDTGAAWVAPVLVDDRDQESYPSGEIVARFVSGPDERVLADLEHAGLRLVRRNAYVDTQVVLAPVQSDGVYLPDLSARLAARDDVTSAWLGTTSQYRKSDDGDDRRT